MTKYVLPLSDDAIVDAEFLKDRLSIAMGSGSVELIKDSDDICIVRENEKYSAQQSRHQKGAEHTWSCVYRPKSDRNATLTKSFYSAFSFKFARRD